MVNDFYFLTRSQQKLSKTTISKSHVIDMPDDDVESGNGQSLPHSPDLTENVRNLSTPTSETGTMRDNDSGLVNNHVAICPSSIFVLLKLSWTTIIT